MAKKTVDTDDAPAADEKAVAGVYVLNANWTHNDRTETAGSKVKLSAADAKAMGDMVRPATAKDVGSMDEVIDLTPKPD